MVCDPKKNRGRSKKTEGRKAPKNKDGSLAVGTYLQKACFCDYLFLVSHLNCRSLSVGT